MRSHLPLLAALLAVTACNRTQPIRLGLVSGLTGRHSDLGISSRNGAELAVADLNAAGGIGGRPLELLARDDGQDPVQARRAVQALVDEGVVAIVGHATSSMVAETLPIVDEAQVFMLSPTATSPDFSGRDDWLARVMAENGTAARIEARAALERLHARRIAVVADASNAAYTDAYQAIFREAVEARGAEVVQLPFASARGGSFSALAEAVVRERPDALLVVAGALDTAALFQQVRKRAPGLRLLGSEWGFTQEILAQGGAATEGAIFSQQVNVADGSPRFRRFTGAYEARFHRSADFAAVASYEAVLVLAEALRRDPTRAGVRREVLRIGTFAGLQGPIRIDRFGDAERRVYLFTVEGGRVVPLE